MEIKRAEEIINSKGIIEVTYKNSPVWLENIISENETVQVKMLHNDQTMNIPVHDLTEKRPAGSYH